MPKRKRSPRFITIYRLFFAAVSLAVLIVEYTQESANPGFNAIDFFISFDVAANNFAVLILLASALAGIQHQKVTRLYLWRGLNVLIMTVLGLSYWLLNDSRQTEWTDLVLNLVMPAAVILDALLDPPKRPPKKAS